MNLARAVRIIKRQCGFRTDGDSVIIECLQDAQEHFETTWPYTPLPWFLLSERSGTTGAADDERLLLPSDFIMEYEEDALWLQLPEGGEKPLRKYDADDLREVMVGYSDSQLDYQRTQYNYAYALTGTYFRIFPTPTIEFSYKMLYYQKDTVLDESDTSVTNLWLTHAPWVLIGSAGETYALAIRDSQAFGYFQQKKGAAIQALRDYTDSRQVANRRMAIGETL